VAEKRTIHKHVVKVAERIRIYVPAGSKLLLVGWQAGRMEDGEIGFWYEVPDLTADPCLSPQEFVVVGTGGIVPDGVVSVVSVIAGAYVWHVYALPR
jgi:hypothetical protein